jgi:hypothetical protein
MENSRKVSPLYWFVSRRKGFTMVNHFGLFSDVEIEDSSTDQKFRFGRYPNQFFKTEQVSVLFFVNFLSVLL